MQIGSVVSLHIARKHSQPMMAVEQVLAVSGKGLEGDRHFGKTENRQVTLIEIEGIEALTRDYQTSLLPGDARRAIVTRGVALNHLVGREFQVGEVRMRGTKLCEPCDHLAQLTSETIKKGLIHRGGLCAQILTDGVIRPGDCVSAD
jgi:MOSC domain-containing protein YiiM